MDSIRSISPIDGRYANKTEELQNFFSEYGLIRYRIYVEIEYFIALHLFGIPQLKDLSEADIDNLRQIVRSFSPEEAEQVKEIEKVTNHDVKAVEYFIKQKMDLIGLSDFKEFVHFGLTSQDINNTAVPLSFKRGLESIYFPLLDDLIEVLVDCANDWKHVPMLARTHGQPASPTTLGKEIMVFISRLDQQIKMAESIPHEAKFGGATGNFNAHFAAYPNKDWESFAKKLLEEGFDLKRLEFTTQIANYDLLAAHFETLARINTILIDFCRDVWHYISIEYFKQRTIKGEIGSSAMPHKVNPIDFENAEGNLGVANALYHHLAQKLPISRLQRDLTDSTVLRNIGVPVAHSLIALKSLLKGMSKLELNHEALNQDLEKNWAVVAEGIQNILRRENYPNPYEALLDLTRGKSHIGEKEIKQFIEALNVEEEIKVQLRKLTPQNYIGNAGNF